MATRIQQFPHSVGGAPGPHTDVVDDLTPQLGGTLSMNTFSIEGSDARGPGIRDVDSLLTAVLNPNKANPNTGVGWRATNQFDMIAGDVPKMTFGSSLIRMRDNVTFQVAGGPQIQNLNATTIIPVFVIHGSDPDTGLGGVLNTSLNAIVNGSSKMQWGTSESIFAQLLRAAVSGGPSIQNETASLTNPVFSPNNSLLSTGVGGDASNNLSMINLGVESARFTTSAVGDDVRMMLYDVTAGTLKQVTRGAVDSGGTGFRSLNVAN